MSSAGEVCGYRIVGRKGKRSELWDEMRGLTKEKKMLQEKQLQTRRESDKIEYKRINGVGKRKTQEKKDRVDEMFEARMSRNFRDNKNYFGRKIMQKQEKK